jgi:hypothetical protein
VRIVQRRLSLVRLVIALFVARIVITVAEIAESRLTFFSLLVSLAIGLEAWRAWRVANAARSGGIARERVPDSIWDRMLRPVERVGPAALYAFTAVFAAVYVVMVVTGGSRDTLLDIVVAAREATTVAIIAVLAVGYLSIRNAEP